MSTRLRAVGGVLLSVLEAVLALLVLIAVSMLAELRAVDAGGGTGGSAEGTFVVGFLGLWLLTGTGLTVVVGAHGLVGAIRVARSEGLEALSGRLRRSAAEVFAAGVLVVGIGFGTIPADGYSTALVASAVGALAVLLHVAVDAVQFTRGVVTWT